MISAQAFHWVAPEVRFAQAAAALDPSGALAIIGNASVFERSPLREALDRVYALYAPALCGPSPTLWYTEQGPIPRLFAKSRDFGPVRSRRYPRSQSLETADYLDLLRTQSDHLVLPFERRESLLGAVRETIEMHGGRIEVRYDAHLYVASRQG